MMEPTPRREGFPRFRCYKDGCKEESSTGCGQTPLENVPILKETVWSQNVHSYMLTSQLVS